MGLYQDSFRYWKEVNVYYQEILFLCSIIKYIHILPVSPRTFNSDVFYNVLGLTKELELLDYSEETDLQTRMHLLDWRLVRKQPNFDNFEVKYLHIANFSEK